MNDKLEHVGVLGMKWGKRKASLVNKASQSIESFKNRNKNNSEEFIRSRELRKKNIKKMTNKELNEYIQRANLEMQYKNLKKNDISEGRKIVNNVLKETLKETLKESVKYTIKETIKSLKDN